ncbi:MAG: hypothetical protein WD431_15875 [Cyclobacteriaceae bacterium]
MIYPSCLPEIYDHPGINDKDLKTTYDAHEQVVFRKGDFILK